jgi:hypothetical protein
MRRTLVLLIGVATFLAQTVTFNDEIAAQPPTSVAGTTATCTSPSITIPISQPWQN